MNASKWIVTVTDLKKKKNYDSSSFHTCAKRFSFEPINLLFKCVKISLGENFQCNSLSFVSLINDMKFKVCIMRWFPKYGLMCPLHSEKCLSAI